MYFLRIVKKTFQKKILKKEKEAEGKEDMCVYVRVCEKRTKKNQDWIRWFSLKGGTPFLFSWLSCFVIERMERIPIRYVIRLVEGECTLQVITSTRKLLMIRFTDFLGKSLSSLTPRNESKNLLETHIYTCAHVHTHTDILLPCFERYTRNRSRKWQINLSAFYSGVFIPKATED